MKLLKKVIIIFTFLFMITYLLTRVTYTNINVAAKSPINIGVVLYRFDDLYISEVKKTLEGIEENNKEKVKFLFYDSKDNQSVQNSTISNLIETGKVDILLVDLVKRDAESARSALDMAKVHKIPVVFTFVNPEAAEAIKSYDKAFVIGTDTDQAGELQGKIISDIWNTNKASIDKNNDNTLQYILLKGSNESAGKQRILNTISEINKAGIKTQPFGDIDANWSRELAKDAVNSMFLKYDGKIEAIISNSDDMAIGAIEALQKYGYNTGNPSKTTVVVGIDGMPEAIELINKGDMAGTLIQPPSDTAEALYAVGMNLYNDENPLKGTNYKVDKSGVVVLLPYKIYEKNNVPSLSLYENKVIY